MANGKPSDGCITGHQAFIYDRGGMTRVGQLLDISEIRWERDRDGVSEASVKIAGAACSSQRDLLSQIASKRHELVIFRGEDRVWEGPVFRIGDELDQFTLFAKDVGAYLFGTPLSRVWDNSSTGDGPTEMTTRMENIITWELTHSRTGRAVGGGTVPITGWELLTPPANILPFLNVHHFPNEARTAAKTLAFQMTVGTHLASAARSSGIDYVTVGRAIHIWDTSRSLGRTRTLTEKDFYGPIIITEYGADHTQIAYSIGQEGVYGEAANPNNLDFYGPWTTIYTPYNEEGSTGPTQSELNSQASRNTVGRSPAPVEVRVPDNSRIQLSNDLTINDLIPGVQIPLLATLNARSMNQLQKLDHVTVIENANGETIQVTLTPATQPDSDAGA